MDLKSTTPSVLVEDETQPHKEPEAVIVKTEAQSPNPTPRHKTPQPSHIQATTDMIEPERKLSFLFVYFPFTYC